MRVISHEHHHTLEKRWNDNDGRFPHASERGEDDDDIWSCCLMESGGRALSSSYFARSPLWLKNVRTIFVPPSSLFGLIRLTAPVGIAACVNFYGDWG